MLKPVLNEGDRGGYAKLRWQGHQLQVTSPIATYHLSLAPSLESAYPAMGMPEVHLNHGRITGQAALFPSKQIPLERLQGVIRSLFRADPYLSPHQLPPDWGNRPTIASIPQRAAIQALLAMEQTSPAGNYKRGVVMPVGIGKTPVSAKYVEAIHQYMLTLGARGWGKPPKVLNVIESTNVNKQTVRSFQRELSFERIAQIFEKRWPVDKPLPDDLQMIAISRSSYFRRLDLIHDYLAADPFQPWIIIVDEAHHIGTDDGQYEAILADLESRLRPNMRLLLLSATLWHRDKELIVKYLQGNIFGSFLNEHEMQLLKKGLALAELTRTQMYRSVELGYNAPLWSLDTITSLGGSASRLTQAINPQMKKDKKIKVPYALLEKMSEKILQRRVPGVPDRGVISVPIRILANEYVQPLAKLLGAEVRAYHRGEGSENDTLDWLNDEGNYDSDVERAKDKYAVAVELLTEGDNIPKLNVLGIARHFVPNRTGFRRLTHLIGRLNRLAPLKGHFRVVDATGLTRMLHGGLSRMSVERRDPINPPPNFIPTISVDEVDYTPLEFEETFSTLFPGDGEMYARYPYYDPDDFQHSGMTVVKDRAIEFGISQFNKGFASKRIAVELAEALPDCDAKADLLEQLRDDEDWGWVMSDGFMADSGSRAALERLYTAFFEIALIWNLFHEGDIDLEKLHTAQGVNELFDKILPWKRSLRTKKEIADFTRPNGDQNAFFSASRVLAIKTVSTPEGIAELAVTILKQLPASALRDQLIAQAGDLDYWNWSQGDARNGSNEEIKDPALRWFYELRRGHQRVARLIHAATYLAQRDSGYAGTSFRDLIAFLFPEKLLDQVPPKYLTQFVDRETGGKRALVKRLSFFGLKTLNEPFSTRLIADAIVNALPRSVERDRTLRSIRSPHYGWKRTDGNRIPADEGDAALERFLRPIYLAAQLYERHSPNVLQKRFLFSEYGFSQFIDRLFLGEALPVFNRVKHLQYMSPEGTGSCLLGIGLETMGTSLRNPGQLKAFLLSLVGGLASTRENRAVGKWIQSAQWNLCDGDAKVSAREEGFLAAERIYRALAWIAQRYNASGGSPPLPSHFVHRCVVFKRLVEALR